ncbi:MAG: hypothetical protein QM582_16560 [Micropruina sp.]|uniref:hypothetical protein n=1 Tax=Micropruina sp. TaxID=2737536 RepID=UPI0039E4ED9F
MTPRWDFWRSRNRGAPIDGATVAHLEDFVRTRRGVEAFLEPQTTMARTSLLLVAHDGEWTRRSIESPAWGRRFAGTHGLPVYDAAVVGYPQRMRDFNARQKGRRVAE